MSIRVVQGEEMRREYRRRALDRAVAAAPRCPVCGTALHPYLIKIGMNVHPCCEDEAE